jgi:hypothetical protein
MLGRSHFIMAPSSYFKILILGNMNTRTFIFSRLIMAGAIELVEYLLLSNLPWFVFVDVCVFVYFHIYVIIGLCAIVYAFT